MDYLKDLQAIEKQVNDAKIQKAKLEQKVEQLTEERTKLIADLDAEGIKEDDLVQTITNLKTEVEEEILECQALLK